MTHKPFEIVADFKYLGMTAINQNCFWMQVKFEECLLQSSSDSFVFFSRLKGKEYNCTYCFVLYGCQTWYRSL